MKSFDELKALIEQRGVHAVFGTPGEGWAIEQNADELAQFLVVCQEQGVQSVLEIGTGYRAGLARFLHDDMGWQVTSVDIHDYGHRFDGIQFLNSDGVELPVFDQQFDLVMIDADHAYDAVKFDHAYYGKYAAKIVAFHDIEGLRECEGVRDYWLNTSRKEGLPHLGAWQWPMISGYHEIIAPGEQCGGIGYLVLSEVERAEHPIVIVSNIARQSVKNTITLDRAPAVGEGVPAVEVNMSDKPSPKQRTPAKKPAARKTVAKK